MKKLLLIALVLNLCSFVEGQAQSQTSSRKRSKFSPHLKRPGFAKPPHSWLKQMKGDSSEIALQDERLRSSLPPHLQDMEELPPHLEAERRWLWKSENERTGMELSDPLNRLYLSHKRPLAQMPAPLKSGASQILSGSVQEAWVARNHEPGSSYDEARDIAVDVAGNIYVTGYIYISAGTSSDYLTVKYDAAGVRQWTARYDGGSYDYAVALAVDGAGNVYVTGSSPNGTSYDYTTIKYNSAGAQQWVATYNGPGSTYDAPVALAIDGTGNVYVTGISGDGGSDARSDYATIKYNSAGQQQWAARFDGQKPDSYDEAAALAVDVYGNVYVTGTEDIEGDADYATVKYNSAGTQEWVATYNGFGHQVASALAIDLAGNVYVTGYHNSSAAYATVKYNSVGQQQWVARFDGPIEDDEKLALAVDGGGNIYVAGAIGVYPDLDYVTIKYNSIGQQQWVARYNGSGNGKDYIVALGIDATGNVYVTGGSSWNGTSDDYATVKYNAAGIQQWVATYNGSANGYDSAIALAVDGVGNIYVTGSSYSSNTGMDYVTIKYTQSPIADAGPDQEICAVGSVPIGGSPTGSGGRGGPYTFGWSPATGLDNPTAANPIASPATTTIYTVTVTETATGLSATDDVKITVPAVGWSVAHIVDVDDVIFGMDQGAITKPTPRDNRGLALSPDERFLYLGYSLSFNQRVVRKIDLSVSDPANNHSAVVAQLKLPPGSQPARDIATDDKGRVYLALGTKIEVYNSNLQTPPLYIISGFTACEGVAVRRESNGVLAVYAADRLDKTLERFVLIEGAGETIASSNRAGLDGDGEVGITALSRPRGLDIASNGTVWIADLGKSKVYRINSVGKLVDSTGVKSPMDIAIDESRSEVYVSQYTLRTMKVLNLSTGKIKRTLTPPAADLNLDLDGETGLGALCGIDVASCQRVYVANEQGRSLLTSNGDSPFSNVGDNNNIKAADTDPVLLVTGNVLAKESEESEGEESEVASDQLTVTSYQLEQNYPNPFWSEATSRLAGNPGTQIRFALPEAGSVTVAIYSITGQLVRTLVDREMNAGRHELQWNGRDQSDKTVAAGIYFYRMTVTGADGGAVFTATRRMTILK